MIKKKIEIELFKVNILLILRLGLIWLIFGGVIRLDWNLKLGFLNFRLGVIVIKFFGVCD